MCLSPNISFGSVPELTCWLLQFSKPQSTALANSGPSTPGGPQPRQLAHLRDHIGSRPPSSPGSPAPQSQLTVSDPLHPTSVVTPQQFHDHFTALTLLTEHEQDSLYRDHLAEIVRLREKCDSLIGLLSEGETEVEDMLKALGYVEERSESLRGACEDLLEEQVRSPSACLVTAQS